MQTSPAIDTVDFSPLIRALANGNAVIFVGAGASLDAGMPSWKAFLSKCIDQANCHRASEQQLNVARTLLETGDFLLAAEILQNVLDSELPEIVRKHFSGSESKPTEIHSAIASLPFSLALTTNYDRLLELAYSPTAHTVTWRQAEDMLRFIREFRFVVAKIHGDCENQSSIVLTRTSYRKLMHLNQAFTACMKTLLLTRTLLFVGCSLRDHDLLSLIEEARSEFDTGFGPHYAILLNDQIDRYLIDSLRECYRIHVIAVGGNQTGTRHCTLSNLELPNSPLSSVIADVLTGVGGRVALERYNAFSSYPTFNSLFSLRNAMETLLKKATTLCGAQRADICLVAPNDDARRVIYRMIAYSVHDQTPKVFDPPELFDVDTIQGRLFLQRKIDSDYVYISNLRNGYHELNLQGYAGLACNQIHNDSACLISVPIYTDGRRSGILTVEAERLRAFTRDHLEVIRNVCREIGWAHYEARQRVKACLPLQRYFKDMLAFSNLMRMSRLLAEFELVYMLYAIDPYNGCLNGYYVDTNGRTCDSPFTYFFSETSLATAVLRDRRKRVYDPARAGEGGNEVSARGLDKFQIKGPIFGLPLHCKGVTAGVLVCWSRKEEDAFGKNKQANLERSSERVRRIAHLIANDPSEMNDSQSTRFRKMCAERFIEVVNRELRRIDKGKSWGPEMYKSASWRKKAIDCLAKVLVDSSCGLRRVRIWLCLGKLRAEECAFICIKSINRISGDGSGRVEIDKYVGKCLSWEDPYLKYIVARSAYDPYARVLDATMLGNKEEPLGKVLDKAPHAPWIVAPIISKGNLDEPLEKVRVVGFLAADMHYFDAGTKSVKCEEVPNDLQTYQRYCVDLVTDVLGGLLRYERLAQSRRFK